MIERKKMYKSGKHWVVATVVASSLLVGTNAVSADQTTDTTKADMSQTTVDDISKQDSNEVKLTSQTTTTDVLNDSDTQNNEEVETSQTTPEVAPTTASNVTSNEEQTASVAPAANASDVIAPTSTKAQTTSTAADTTKQATSEAPAASEKTEATAEVTTTKAAEPVATVMTKTQTRPTLNETAQKIVAAAKLDKNNLTDDQINALNKIVVDDQSPSGTKMTYKDFENIANTLVAQDARYAIPYFNASQIKNMPAAYTRDAQTGEYADLDVWDSWPVQDAKTGQVINWNGYQLVVAMMGIPAENDSHLYLLYNKYGDNDFANWKNAGSIFGYNETPLRQEWSGSATVNSDGTLQLYYTLVDTSDSGLNNQKIASAVITLDHDDNNVSIASVDNDHVIFEGDGYHYQTYKQWRETNRGADNIAMRDAHIVQTDDGSRYLVFEASTGLENYQGEDQIFNWKNYGGDAAYNAKSFFDILGNEDIKSRASWANAAIGILKLNDNEKYPEVEQVYTPLLTANMVSDEIERPNIVKLGDKYYLFAATRLNRGSNDYAWWNANYAVGDNVAMIGYVSDQLTGGYKPLNGSGVVLTASVPANWRTATYSYYAVPVEGYTDRVLVTAYMTNRGEVAGKGQNATWAPSFLVQINPDGTTKVLAKMTNQGDWIWDEGSENPEMLGTLETAALPGEREKPVDWDLIGYGLKPHQPANPLEPTTPETPDVPEVPTTPETPNVPKVPTTPETPSVPEVPTTPETPSDPETPLVPEEYVVPTEPTSHIAQNTQTELPQLNEEKGGSLATLAAGISAILLGLGLKSNKKRRSN